MKEKENPCSNRKKSSKSVILNLFQDLVVTKGFTLLEVIVAIIIIGALLAFALPKYETALDKSRFSTLMPLTKSIKDAEEVFYIASNQYTEDVSSLDVKVNPGETVQVSVKDDDDYSYVQAIDPRIENIYKAYLKHSTNFPEERHCEALTDSTRAKKVCETLGGTLLDESGDYTVYVLEGTGNGSVNTEKQCEGETPSTEQACSSGCGTQTRTVSCDTSTGEWELGEWTGTCPVQGETSQSCTQGVGTETRTYTCEGNTWVPNEWDKSSCTCDPTAEPATTQDCTEGTGTETRTNTCSGTTWVEGTWDTSACVVGKQVVGTAECTTQTTLSDCVRYIYNDGSFTEVGTYKSLPASLTYDATGTQIAYDRRPPVGGGGGSMPILLYILDSQGSTAAIIGTTDGVPTYRTEYFTGNSTTDWGSSTYKGNYTVRYNTDGSIAGYTKQYTLVNNDSETYYYNADGSLNNIYKSGQAYYPDGTTSTGGTWDTSTVSQQIDLTGLTIYSGSEAKADYCALAPASAYCS